MCLQRIYFVNNVYIALFKFVNLSNFMLGVLPEFHLWCYLRDYPLSYVAVVRIKCDINSFIYQISGMNNTSIATVNCNKLGELKQD